MIHLDEYRDGNAIGVLVSTIRKAVTHHWTIMEVCGGQTHSIVKSGLDELLPPQITLVHGPGCPVCVTPVELIDAAVEIAMRQEITFCSYGDMLRVPGSSRDLFSAKAAGADIRIVYSPLDAVKIAQNDLRRNVVFFAVGFETTAPAHALAVLQAQAIGLKNFSLLVSHVLVPPAMAAILSSPQNRVNGFLAPGHVCTVVGVDAYQHLASQFKVPIVVTGFEPVDILAGVLECVQQLEEGRAELANPYARVVRPEGNLTAQRAVEHVFEVTDRNWRGIGKIGESGLGLRKQFEAFDALKIHLNSTSTHCAENSSCISGEILMGVKKPSQCAEFGTRCTPESPMGATMVSGEGACAAYYRYR